jgi:tetratricopeptide (TPR) repeat protein
MILILAAAAAPQSASAANFDQIARDAAEARAANRSADAIRLYRHGVEVRPNWAEGWWFIASLLYEDDHYADAAPVFTRYLKLEPKSAPGWTMLGLCEYQLGDYETSLKHLTLGKSLGLPESNQMAQVARYHRGALYTHFGQFYAALDELKLFSFPPVESPKVIEAIGVAALRRPLLPQQVTAEDREFITKTGRAVFDSWAARPAEAEREFKELLSSHADNAHIHYLYGSYLLQSHSDAALGELTKCLELDPKYVPAMLQLAFEYLSRGEPAKGIPPAEDAVRLAPDSFVAHNALGRLLLENGDSARAITELQAAVKLAPEVPECHFALASAYMKAGRRQDGARENAEFLRLKKTRGESAAR